MDKNIGRKLDGRYEITELIGVGGMADVYKAMDILENKVVAVKILKNEFANDEEFLRRFRNESKAIAVLSHPNIVKVLDVGFTEKIQFIVMEYIDGITLKEFMEQQGVLKWKDSMHFIIQILRALQHAHDRGIVHRDIKPQNIMLFPDGAIKVMDFGIARFAREEGRTLSDKAIGSVHYISPEQARGETTDEKSDIYSVGIMLYEMLTGTKPYDANNPVAVALMHMQSVAKPLREINEDIPEGLEEIVHHAIQKDSNKRYQSAAEMIKDIEAFKRNPSVIFEYNYMQPRDEDTRYFSPVGVKAGVKEESTEGRDIVSNFSQKQPYQQYDPDALDEEEEGRGRSLFVPILTAIAAAVVIIAAFFIVTMVITNLGGGATKTLTMPDIIGKQYQVVSDEYVDEFRMEIDAREYSEYDDGIIFWASKNPGDAYKQGTTIHVKVSKGIKDIIIPDLTNTAAEAAIQKLEGDDYNLVVVPTYMVDDDIMKDYVVKTDPPSGEAVRPNSQITVYISRGPELLDFKIPDFINMNRADAVKLLNDSSVKHYFLEPKDSKEPLDTIVAQSKEAGEILKPGEELILWYSTGKAPSVTRALSVPVTSGASGSYTFTAYVNGLEAGSTTVDNVGYAGGTVSLNVKGSEQQRVSVEIQNTATKQYSKLVEYQMDFDTGKVERVFYDESAFEKTGGAAQVETTTQNIYPRPDETDSNDGGIIW